MIRGDAGSTRAMAACWRSMAPRRQRQASTDRRRQCCGGVCFWTRAFRLICLPSRSSSARASPSSRCAGPDAFRERRDHAAALLARATSHACNCRSRKYLRLLMITGFGNPRAAFPIHRSSVRSETPYRDQTARAGSKGPSSGDARPVVPRCKLSTVRLHVVSGHGCTLRIARSP